MIIGIPYSHSRTMEVLRKAVDHPNVLIWPEFMDAKFNLVKRHYAPYIGRLLAYRNQVIVAVWPDWYREIGLARMLDVAWIYPLHSLDEIDFVLKLDSYARVVFLGYPSNPRYGDIVLRSYTIQQFVEIARMHGLPMWYLGASKKELREALYYGFNGVDISPRTCGIFVDASPETSLRFARCVENLARTLDSSGLLRWLG